MRYLPLLIIPALLAACDSKPGAVSASGKPKVVATTTMIGDLVAQIGGDKVDLTVVMPAGTDPHTYKPKTKDLGDIAGASRVFYNGLHLEGKMVELFEEKMKGKAIAVTSGLDHGKDLIPWKDGDAGAHDPHVWFDVTLWARAGQLVKDTLVKDDPANAAHYEQRYTAFAARMDALDKYVKDAVASIAAERRVLITSHDAFSYFGRRYGVDVRGLQGISTETEAGLSNVREAVQFIVARKIPAIFVESSVNPQTINRVQADCKAAGWDVKIGGELYSDAMGAPGEHAGYAVETYDGMVRYNTDLLVKGLK
ncbi:MAG TPA: zinc ABC transporter substrate-binding protein [Tepidisphaeraceae bacterium]|nr:zinc ABC transporter substrate-binding protein [Tepidisphaeraceae bacterium]